MGIGRHELAERGGARARQADHEHRSFHLLVVDLRMRAVGVLDPQPRRQRAGEAHPQHDLTGFGQVGLGVQRRREALEPLAVRPVAEVLEAGGSRASCLQRVGIQRHRENRLLTASRRAAIVRAPLLGGDPARARRQ